jgi:phosphoglycolate phosphatase-like HAD superfamily hydrolase
MNLLDGQEFLKTRTIGVPCPDTWLVRDIKDPANLPFPVFLKPRCGRASLNVHRADNLDAYLHYISQTDDLIIQPFLTGEEVTIDTLSDFEGRFLMASPRIRTEVKSGQAYRSVTIDAPELTAYAKKIVEGLPVIGPSNIQCFRTDQGPQFFEINARFGAGTVLTINAGGNGPAALVAMAKDQRIPVLKPRPGVLMFRYWQEVFVEKKGLPIFLDLDGPILDVSQRHYQVYRDILEEAGKPVIPFEQYWKEKRARTSHSSIVTRTAGSDFFSDIFQKQWFARIEADRYLSLDKTWPWANDVLADLYRRHDLYLLTVRSHSDQLMKQLDRLDLTRWFRAVLCRPARENAAQQKIEAIRNHFQDIPRKAIVVGDTEADIACGKKLGFVTAGVLSGIRNSEHLQESQCDHLLDNIISLPKLIAAL